MPSFVVETPQRSYPIVVERGGVSKLGEHIPARPGKLFFLSTQDVWQLHGDALLRGAGSHPREVLFFRGGESRKRLAEVEALADEMVDKGGDRASVVVAFGGGIHRCLGSNLARVELRTAMREWHRRIPEYSLEPGAELVYQMGLRQIDTLPLKVRAGAPP